MRKKSITTESLRWLSTDDLYQVKNSDGYTEQTRMSAEIIINTRNKW